ncbi:hypothetical protein ABN115_20420 [Providencia rettgeri]
MCGVTSENKKMVELVVNGAPVSFYDVNNGNTIGALSFLNKVIETLAGENAELIDEAIVSQFTIDAKNIGKLETRTIASGEVALNSASENEGQQTLPYGDTPFIYAAKLNLPELVKWLGEQLRDVESRSNYLSFALCEVESLINQFDFLASHQVVPESILLSQGSNLLLDSNQCLQLFGSALYHLRNSGLTKEDFPGKALLEEQKQSSQESLAPNQE